MASNFFARQGAAFKNDLNRSLGALVGIAQGLLCDGVLNDDEIRFLDRWLVANESLSLTWPGDVLHARVRAVLADGVIAEEERAYLVATLQSLIGGSLEELAEPTHVTALAFDHTAEVTFEGRRFVLTGDFVFGPRKTCSRVIELHGGEVASSITRKVDYVVVGGLGSPEWKHGSFGIKIETAMQLRRDGLPIALVQEDQWANAIPRTAAA
ncbi:BRCT domain-containing protein [Derxia lacustris]|uniref:BRCT domain-containing protein n=1 Tax=Derxia lacustris TaxID=764842 RepID=UPI000A177483|nr:BRCT domain-containing protein [Derxia lacustris]